MTGYFFLRGATGATLCNHEFFLGILLVSVFPFGCGDTESIPHITAERLYSGEPDFAIRPMGFYATGVLLTRFDKDLRPDLLISNGNDMSPQPLTIHFGGDVGLHDYHKWPSWYSYDHDFQGHLCAGDVNDDGYLDVAVPVAFNKERRLDRGLTKLYLQRVDRKLGSFQLESQPSFRTDPGYLGIACAFGDADGDGDLDLAVVAALEMGGTFPDDVKIPIPDHHKGRVRIYRNDKGALSPAPAWVSEDRVFGGDVLFADINGDGHMDLAVAGDRTKIYYGEAKATDKGRLPLPKKASWVSSDEHQFSYSLDVGHLGKSRKMLLAVSKGCIGLEPRTMSLSSREPTCSEGSSFLLYDPKIKDRAPIWRSTNPVHNSSRLLLADVNADGYLDLIAGQWGERLKAGPLLIYQGGASGLSDTKPTYQSKKLFVAQGVDVSDIRHRGVCSVSESFDVKPGEAVFTLSHRRVEHITALIRHDRSGSACRLNEDRFAWTVRDNWVSVSRQALEASSRIEAVYEVSPVADIVVADWRPQKPVSVFYSRVKSNQLGKAPLCSEAPKLPSPCIEEE